MIIFSHTCLPFYLLVDFPHASFLVFYIFAAFTKTDNSEIPDNYDRYVNYSKYLNLENVWLINNIKTHLVKVLINTFPGMIVK